MPDLWRCFMQRKSPTESMPEILYINLADRVETPLRCNAGEVDHRMRTADAGEARRRLDGNAGSTSQPQATRRSVQQTSGQVPFSAPPRPSTRRTRRY